MTRLEPNKVVFEGDLVKIHLSGKNGRGKVTVTDLASYIKHDLGSITWSCDTHGYVSAWGKKEKKTVYMHRIITSNTSSKFYTDHINRTPLDNRSSNLRITTNKRNQQNTEARIDNKIGYKCVTFDKGKYNVKMKFDGIKEYFGCYDTSHQAALAYNIVAKVMHGEFAYMNDIPKGSLTSEEIDLVCHKVDKRIQIVLSKRNIDQSIKVQNTYTQVAKLKQAN